MNSSLQKRFNELEAQRIQLLSSLKNLSGEKLNYQSNGHWSINHIIAHLITAERLSLQYLTKKIQGVDTIDNTGLLEELKMIALIISQRLPFKFKAPRLVVENTPSISNINELEQEWQQVRYELKNFLEKIKDEQIKRKIYKHIIAGKLNIQHALIFLGEHIIHHQPQINRLL